MDITPELYHYHVKKVLVSYWLGRDMNILETLSRKDKLSTRTPKVCLARFDFTFSMIDTCSSYQILYWGIISALPDSPAEEEKPAVKGKGIH